MNLRFSVCLEHDSGGRCPNTTTLFTRWKEHLRTFFTFLILDKTSQLNSLCYIELFLFCMWRTWDVVTPTCFNVAKELVANEHQQKDTLLFIAATPPLLLMRGTNHTPSSVLDLPSWARWWPAAGCRWLQAFVLPAVRGCGRWLQKNTDCCCPTCSADEQSSSLLQWELPVGSELRGQGVQRLASSENRLPKVLKWVCGAAFNSKPEFKHEHKTALLKQLKENHVFRIMTLKLCPRGS